MSNLAIAKDPSYYTDVVERIKKLGYIDPSQDHEDPRQKKIWQSIMLGNWDLEIIEGFDCVDLAERTDPLFQRFQTRSDCEADIQEYFEDFYELDIKQERIVFGMRIDGKIYIFLGNKRVRAHEKGIKEGYDSRANVVLVDCGDVSLAQHLKTANKLARIGNKKRHDTRREGEADYVHQIIQAYEIECMMEPKMKNWTSQKKIKWGRKFLVEEIEEKYGHKNMKKRAGDIVNSAFAEHRGQSLPMPDLAARQINFKSFFPKNNWNEESTRILMKTTTTHFQSLKSQLLDGWSERPEFTKVRKKCWLILRCGHKKDSVLTSLETVVKARASTAEELQRWNTNINNIGAGYPIIDRILFVQQMNIDSYEAYEWNDETENFDIVDRSDNGPKS